MWHKSDFYIIGLYEDMKGDIYPSHFTPIIAEKKLNLYRRWTYSIKKPYRIELCSAMGSFKETPEDLFPVKTLHYLNPIKLNCKTQVVALNCDRILISDSKSKLIIQVLGAVLTKKPELGYLIRVMKTIKNIIE
ncbi:hypothetical protein [Photobacterium damselae]|uniref:hypothetical protein n=1 Tax=Photobacterium damselae TaxID=38293 RepID=UPI00165E1E67|nr:hypothetical protein [Photobacterium damselae]